MTTTEPNATRPSARAVQVSVHGRSSWTVVDDSGLPIEEVESFLHWLRAVDRSPNTVRAYARHLSLYFRWLHARSIGWEKITFDQLCDFVGVLSAGLPPLSTPRGTRSDSTTKSVGAAVREFYDYHRADGRGPEELVLTGNPARTPRRSYSFLAHLATRRPRKRTRLPRSQPAPHETMRIIRFEDDFDRLLGACNTSRDRLLLSCMYDLGLRIGQALGLRHADVDPMRNVVRVCRRLNNENGSLSKQREEFTVQAPPRFANLYADYLLGECADHDSDYVFINLNGPRTGMPMTYSNAYQIVTRIGRTAGIEDLKPHMLRHTHATALAKAGWTSAEIAARLGQSNASSADVYIHLANDDLTARLRETEHLVWRPSEGEFTNGPPRRQR